MAQYIVKLVLQWLSVSTVTSDGPVHSEVSVTVVVSFYCHIRWPSDIVSTEVSVTVVVSFYCHIRWPST